MFALQRPLPHAALGAAAEAATPCPTVFWAASFPCSLVGFCATRLTTLI